MSNKELVLEAVNELADDASIGEFAEGIRILDAIRPRSGSQAADAITR